MADPIVLAVSPAASRSREPSPRVLSSLALVFVYWWAATGLTFATQATQATRLLSLIASSSLAVFGFWIVATTRSEHSARSARSAFLGAGLIWWWGAVLFYSGVGLRLPAHAAGAQGSAGLARQAIGATVRPDLVMVIALLAVSAMLWHQKNRVALYTLGVLWGTLQMAKLNVFFGVRNSGANLLPAHLAGLGMFFGPVTNSPLLLPTVLILTVLCGSLALRARQAQAPFDRHSNAMVAMLVGLALVEHLALGIDVKLPFWDIFMPGHS